MRRMAAVALLAALGATGCSLLPTLHVGGGVSAVIPEETETLDITAMLDGFVKIEAAMLQVEASVGWKQYHYTDETGAVEEDLVQVPVAATVRYVMGPGLFRVLLGGGLVWNINDLDELGTVDVNDPLSYRLVAGVDVQIVKSFKMGLEASYDIGSDVDLLSTGNEFNSDGAMVRLTAGYHF